MLSIFMGFGGKKSQIKFASNGKHFAKCDLLVSSLYDMKYLSNLGKIFALILRHIGLLI